MPSPRILNVETEVAPIDVVRPHPRNPRDGDVGAIYQSIEANGFYGVIVAQKSTGHILAGNHRWLAAQQAGATEIPIAWVDIDDDHALRILLADNRTNDIATYHEADLAQLLTEILRDAGTLEGTGYDDEALQELVAAASRADQPGDTGGDNEHDEAADALQGVWGTKIGQTWIIPNPNRPSQPHRLTIGDATDTRTIEHLLAGGKPNIMVTDPPYGVDYDPTWRDVFTSGKGTARRGKVMNDNQAGWADAYRHHPGSVAYVWHSSLHSDVVLAALRPLGFTPRAMIVWVKQQIQISRGAYNWQHEPCIYADRLDNPQALAATHGYTDDTTTAAFLAGLDAARRPIGAEVDNPASTEDEDLDHVSLAYSVRDGSIAHWIGPASESTVWRFDNLLSSSEDKTIHGTQKPLDAFLRPIRNHAGDVFDPFAGSGTALLAATKLTRRAYLAELDPRYAATMLDRFARAGMNADLET